MKRKISIGKNLYEIIYVRFFDGETTIVCSNKEEGSTAYYERDNRLISDKKEWLKEKLSKEDAEIKATSLLDELENAMKRKELERLKNLDFLYFDSKFELKGCFLKGDPTLYVLGKNGMKRFPLDKMAKQMAKFFKDKIQVKLNLIPFKKP